MKRMRNRYTLHICSNVDCVKTKKPRPTRSTVIPLSNIQSDKRGFSRVLLQFLVLDNVFWAEFVRLIFYYCLY